ncbi:MAG: peptidoglycan-associated lipoprotein Pal [Betaproteobacteria bacterium]|nr:MAG: peptidoglycan-associated lipoprotein Pal [Betaproteobacteria bacterium]
MVSTPQEETVVARVREQPAPTRDTADLLGMPSDNSIYFGYDQASLDRQSESVLFAHAEFLKANPGMRVEIQGNCDERGSREYNIALGQRRALTVKRALELLGVEGYRIETVSFGSEKPVAFGHDEESWRQNRRADIVY